MDVEGAVSIRGLELESNSSFNKGSFKNSSGFMQKWGIFPYTQKSIEGFSKKKKPHKITLHNKYKYNDSENLEGFAQHHSEMVKRNESMWSG